MAIKIKTRNPSQTLQTPASGEVFEIFLRKEAASSQFSFGFMPDNNHPDATHKADFMNVYPDVIDKCSKNGFDLLAYVREVLATGAPIEVQCLAYDGDVPSTIKVKPVIEFTD